jgi:ribosome biogenesis GTPase
MATEAGTVIAVDARGASVDVGGETLFCRVRGRFYEERGGQMRPIAPGDRVTIERTTEGEGVVEEIHPRRTRLSRKAAHGELEQVIAANVDRVAIVVSTRDPPLRPGIIDRLIIAASNRGVEPFVVVNKIDLGRERKVEEVRAMFTDLGYEVVLTSATEGWGTDALAAMLADRTTVFAGHSGVGKSSLLNAVDSDLHLKVGEVSHATSKGRHTTTRAELLRLSGGGYVVDTPGIRAFGIWDVERADLDIFFKEFEPLIEQCRFYDCTHEHEPDCAVRAAVEKGEVRRPRYEAYRRILASLEE